MKTFITYVKYYDFCIYKLEEMLVARVTKMKELKPVTVQEGVVSPDCLILLLFLPFTGNPTVLTMCRTFVHGGFQGLFAAHIKTAIKVC